MATKTKIGMIGCGNIAPAYVRGCKAYPILDLIACADLDKSRASAFASEHGLQAYGVDELLGNSEVDILINLTIPKVHAEVSHSIINAGKHVYSEKPLGLTRDQGEHLLQAAEKTNVRVGCAPDTFLGGGGQTVRKLIDDGAIGRPVAATAFVTSRGPESWHPNPGFFYQFGGGPLFDMGPYYLTTLINLLGPVRRVTASAQKSFAERITTSKEMNGTRLPVEVNTHIAGVLDFAGGVVATLITSFDVWQANLPRIEIYGSEGSISVPDPNHFDGTVKLWQPDTGEWREVPHTHPSEIGRGTGVADMAYSIQSGRPHRASGALAFHVLDVMQSLEETSAQGQHINIQSTVQQPAVLPAGLPVGELDT